MAKDLAPALRRFSDALEVKETNVGRSRGPSALSPMVPGGTTAREAVAVSFASTPLDRVARVDGVDSRGHDSKAEMSWFDAFRLDTVNECLWRDDVPVELTPKAFAVLRYLVKHPGRLVTHRELLEALWPETYVQPEILRTYIRDIRKILGDDPRAPRFIETRARRGYRFIAPVSDNRATPLRHLGGAPARTPSDPEATLALLDDALGTYIRDIRRILGDRAEAPQFVEARARRGQGQERWVS